MIAAVGSIILGGLFLRNTAPILEVKDIDAGDLEEGQIHLVDVMENPIVLDESYKEPLKFNCSSLRDKFLRTPISKLGEIDTKKIIEANCEKELKVFEKSPIVKKLVSCLKEEKRTPSCAKNLLYFRAYSIMNLIKTNPELEATNDNVKLHKIIWELATTTDYKKSDLIKLITKLEVLLEEHPYLYALHKAKFIHVVIKDVHYPEKRIDDRMYKSWEMMTELRDDTRDNWELRFMNVLKHVEFFNPKDMKEWANTFLLDNPNYYMSYYYFAYFYWMIEKNKKETISWLNAGIAKTNDPTGKLKRILKKIQNAAPGKELFNFEFNFEIIHD